MYNSLAILPNLSYNIMVALANNNEANDLWKMLKYSGYDALSKPDLTFEDKISLIWKNGPQEQFSVFLTALIEDAIAESKTILKLYNYYIHASELYSSVVVYAFDCLYGGQMSLVEKNGIPVSRGDLFIHTILKVLNGRYIGGVGKLIFFDDMSRYDLARVTMGNSKTFTGNQLFMSVIVGDNGVRYGCGEE